MAAETNYETVPEVLADMHIRFGGDANLMWWRRRIERAHAAGAGRVPADLLRRALPFVRDEAAKYEDDGSNEPLELARDIEAALSAAPAPDPKPAANPSPEPPPAEPAALHPKTADLVRRFAQALTEKLAAAERKYGYSEDWASPDWMDECREKLLQHVAKGDPRDVAAYCMFLWHHGERTAEPAAQSAPSDAQAVPMESPFLTGAGTAATPDGIFTAAPVEPAAQAETGAPFEARRRRDGGWSNWEPVDYWFAVTHTNRTDIEIRSSGAHPKQAETGAHGSAQGDVDALVCEIRSIARRCHFQISTELGDVARRLASAQPATAKPAGDALLASQLIGTARHIRACADYTKLRGDADIIERAATRLTGGSHD